MSEIDTLINQVRIGDNEDLVEDADFNLSDHISENAFGKLFDDSEREVLEITKHHDNRDDNSEYSTSNKTFTEIVDAETMSIASTKTRLSTQSSIKSESEVSSKVSALTHENLLKKQKEEEMKLKQRTPSLRSAKSNRSAKSSVKSSRKSISSNSSHIDYTSLENYKKTQKHKVKTQHQLDLTGSPIDIIDRIDDLVNNICEQYEDPTIKRQMIEEHRNTILVQVFLNTINTTRRDIAKACKQSMSKSFQKKLPDIS